MALTPSEVEHVALLSRLRLTDEEKQQMTRDLNAMLARFEALARVSTEGVPPMSHALTLQNVLRDDIARPSLPPTEAIGDAVDARDEFFVVPRVVET